MATEGAIEPRPELPRELYLGEEDELEDIPISPVSPEAMLGFVGRGTIPGAPRAPLEGLDRGELKRQMTHEAFPSAKMQVSRPDLTRPDVPMAEGYEADILDDIPDPRYVSVGLDEVFVRPETPLDIPVDISEPDPIEIDPVELMPDDISADMIDWTEAEVGDVQQAGVTTVTDTAFRKALSGGAATGNKVVIDPNTNIAQVIDSGGQVIAEYSVGTGDITGKRYGKKYFTPTGLGRIIDKQKRPTGAGQEGPFKLRLSHSFYKNRNPFLLHGQYEPDEIVRERNAFINKGFVSHGCVRFFNNDMNELVTLIGKGSEVEILNYTGEGFGGGQVHPTTGRPYEVHGVKGE